MNHILDLNNYTVYNTIIASSSVFNKIIFLRDIVKQVSSGIKEMKFRWLNFGIIERKRRNCSTL